jgi:uncharacterized protein with GYD domain
MPQKVPTIRASLAALTALAMIAVVVRGAVAQQSAPTMHRYLFRAAFTVEGLKNLQKQSATGFRAGVAKLVESVGGKLDSWYFDYTEGTACGFVEYPDENAAATAQMTVNSAGFARVTYRSVISAEDADKALARSVSTRPPQQQ